MQNQQQVFSLSSITLLMISIAPIKNATAQDCINYWIKPKSGERECLDGNKTPWNQNQSTPHGLSITQLPMGISPPFCLQNIKNKGSGLWIINIPYNSHIAKVQFRNKSGSLIRYIPGENIFLKPGDSLTVIDAIYTNIYKTKYYSTKNQCKSIYKTLKNSELSANSPYEQVCQIKADLTTLPLGEVNIYCPITVPSPK